MAIPTQQAVQRQAGCQPEKVMKGKVKRAAHRWRTTKVWRQLVERKFYIRGMQIRCHICTLMTGVDYLLRVFSSQLSLGNRTPPGGYPLAGVQANKYRSYILYLANTSHAYGLPEIQLNRSDDCFYDLHGSPQRS